MALLLKELGSTGTEQEPGEKVTGILAGHCHLNGHLFKLRCVMTKKKQPYNNKHGAALYSQCWIADHRNEV